MYYNLSVDPADATIWYLSTSRGVYKTADNGVHWIERGAYTLTVPSTNVSAGTGNVFSMTSVKKQIHRILRAQTAMIFQLSNGIKCGSIHSRRILNVRMYFF